MVESHVASKDTVNASGCLAVQCYIKVLFTYWLFLGHACKVHLVVVNNRNLLRSVHWIYICLGL